jgi:hypothetical protein
MEFASVQLFVDRARAATLDFRITRQNAEAVARLCHWLEGIPLAIELAAAAAGVLTARPDAGADRRPLRFSWSAGAATSRTGTGRCGRRWIGATGCSCRTCRSSFPGSRSSRRLDGGGGRGGHRENDVLDCLEYLRDFRWS